METNIPVGSTVIQIKSGSKHYQLLVSEFDKDLLAGWRITASPDGYPEASKPRDKGSKEWLKVRDVILGKASPGFVHLSLNGDKMDCRRENLRTVTKAQHHLYNRSGMRTRNTSGYVGVMFLEKKNKWRANCSRSEIQKTIGEFETAELAARAYDQYVIDHTPEADRQFLHLNFPQISLL